MRHLDRDTAERLLAGDVAPDDAPPGYGLVARLLAALRAHASPRELAVPRRLRRPPRGR